MAKFELRDITRTVPHQIVQRAYGYVLHKIQIVRKEPGLIAAKVRGTELYDTIISQNDYGEYIQSCTCPYGAPCKHTVALAMQITTQSYLQRLIEMSPETVFTHGKQGTLLSNSWLSTITDEMNKLEGEVRSKQPSKIEKQLYYVLAENEAMGERYYDPKKIQLAIEVGTAERKIGQEGWTYNGTRSPRALFNSKSKYFTEIDKKILAILSSLIHGGYSALSWQSVGIDEFAITELLKYLQECSLVFWQMGKIGRSEQRVPIKLAMPTTLALELSENENGWKLIPKTSEPIRIKTVFDYEPLVVLSEANEIIPVTNRIPSNLLRTILMQNTIPTSLANDPRMLETLLKMQKYIPIILPPELLAKIQIGTPTPQLLLSAVTKSSWHPTVKVTYAKQSIDPSLDTSQYVAGEGGSIWERDRDVEQGFVQDFLSKYPQEIIDWEEINRLVVELPSEWEILIEKEEITKVGREAMEAKFENASGINWLDITGEIKIDEEKYSLAEMILAGAGSERIVTLRGKSHLIDESLFKQFQKLSTLADKSGVIKLNRTQIGIVDDLEMLDVSKLHSSWQKTLKAVREFDGIKKLPKIKGVVAKLRPYQVHGVSFLNYLRELDFGGILADDMGLGKTVQAIAMLTKYKAENGKMKVLIVSPTSVVANWESELKKFTPQMKISTYVGTPRILPKKNLEIVLSSYAIIRRDVDTLKTIKWDYLILDEAQYTKNFVSQTARAARAIHAKHRLCLTGTPIENNLSELYSQLEFLNPGMLGTIEEFRKNIAIPVEKRQDAQVSLHLQKLIKPFILRRTKDQVLTELPAKTEQVMTLEMGTKQKEFYETLRQYYQARILKLVDEQGVGRSQFQILEALLRLRQTCCDPRLVKPREHAGSVKLDEIVRVCGELISEGHKVLLFSQFTTMIALIEKEFKKNKIKFQTLTGQTKASERTELIRHFQTDEEPMIFLLSLKAGGIGINLTAADYVIHYDPWWNPAVETQATDRAHRIGQKKAVTVYKMVVKDSIEEKILSLQQKKKDLIDRVIVGGKVGKELSLADLEYLLG